MAQEKGSTAIRRMKVLVRKYGLSAKGAIIAAFVAIVIVCCAVGSAGILANSGVHIERDGEASAEEGQSASIAEEESADVAPKRALVHVDGAVVSPGVYVLEGTDVRVNDAVVLAGGLAPDADTSAINLAEVVSDGQKVHIPAVGEGAPQASSAAAQPVDASLQGDDSSHSASGCINVNTATTEELCQIPGVGEATAAAIIEERESNGPFASVDDLTRVSGIGEKKLAKMRETICV